MTSAGLRGRVSRRRLDEDRTRLDGEPTPALLPPQPGAARGARESGSSPGLSLPVGVVTLALLALLAVVRVGFATGRGGELGLPGRRRQELLPLAGTALLTWWSDRVRDGARR